MTEATTNQAAGTEGAVSGKIVHETTIFAEPVAHIGSFKITNSLIMSWITVLILVVVFVLIGRRLRQVPKGFQNVFEILLEEALKLADMVTGSRKKTERFLPITMALFLFILVNNWLGLIPGVGTIGLIEMKGTEQVLIPYLRGGTADLNTTLAIALFAVVMSHIMGVVMVGAWSHFNKFINFHAFKDMLKKVRTEPIVLIVNPIKIFVSLIELVGEFAKVASLSLRLFGNVFAGEVLLVTMMSLSAYLLPLPFIFLELIVGIVQALVFAILTLAFMAIAATHEEH